MKNYVFEINDSEIKKYGPIRHSNDILLYYINIAKLYINRTPINNQNILDKFIEINVSKYSRVFMKFNESKLISFIFPFAIKENEEGLFYNNLKLKAKLIALFECILHSAIENSQSFIISALNIEADEAIYDEEIKELLELYAYLISFDPGYFRVEHDALNDSNTHPLDHIDLYYSQKCTFKLGYDKSPSIDYIREMVDNNTIRKYIK